MNIHCFFLGVNFMSGKWTANMSLLLRGEMARLQARISSQAPTRLNVPQTEYSSSMGDRLSTWHSAISNRSPTEYSVALTSANQPSRQESLPSESLCGDYLDAHIIQLQYNDRD